MRTERIVKPSESLRAVAREARQQGCIVQIDPINHKAFIRRRLLPDMKPINQIFYRSAA